MLRSQRLSLIPLREEHADSLFPILNDARLHTFIGGASLGLKELRDRYRSFQTRASPAGDELWLNWIAQRLIDGTAVGYLQATVAGEHAILAWVIGQRWQGNGYATEAAKAVIDWLFGYLRVAEVTAHIHPSHPASEGVAARGGLTVTDDIVEGDRVWRLRRPPD